MAHDNRSAALAKTGTMPWDQVSDEVTRLLGAGKAKQAVELAKDEHKRRNTAESEQLLVTAYLARIEQFQSKGAVEDAQTLIKLVSDRFPHQKHRLAAASIKTAAAGGKIDDLVAPLARPDLPREHIDVIESAIRQQVVDIAALAATPVLPATHPLKIAANALLTAFNAVTSGPVTDDQIALREISHKSPLAPWKMLIRAIAALYGNSDIDCSRAMDAIPPDSAARRLVPAMQIILGTAEPHGGAAGALAAKVGRDDTLFREALADIEHALDRQDVLSLNDGIRRAVAACSTSHPELVDGMRQRIFARCMVTGAPISSVLKVLGHQTMDAQFWRLCARAYEGGNPGDAAMYWERFVCHARAQGLIPQRGLEVAAVYAHAAALLTRMASDELSDLRREVERSRWATNFYREQTPEIKVLCPPNDRHVAEHALNPHWLFEQATNIDPDPDVFDQWWQWAESTGLDDDHKEHIAFLWQNALADDPRPRLRLCLIYEARNALQKAMRELTEAEAIDALNPQVRQTRLRLTLAIAWRHFKDARPHLVEKDIAELEALPAMSEGDRPALILAMKSALHAQRGEKEAAQQAADAVVARVGPLLAKLIVDVVAEAGRLSPGNASPMLAAVVLPEPRAIMEASARSIRLSNDLNVRVFRPAAWDPIIDHALRHTPGILAPADLLLVGRSAACNKRPEQAYLASAAGLANASGPMAARFLLLRASSLPFWAHRRVTQCLRTAMALAQQSHDPDLMRDVSAAIDRHPATRRTISMRGATPLTADLVREVLAAERKATAYPKDQYECDQPVVATVSDVPFAGPQFFIDDDEDGPLGEDDQYGYDEDDDEDDEYDPDEKDDLVGLPSLQDMLKQLPPKALRLLQDTMAKHGRLPTPQEMRKADPSFAETLQMMLDMGILPPNAADGTGKKRR
jgi:hypothetical protein